MRRVHILYNLVTGVGLLSLLVIAGWFLYQGWLSLEEPAIAQEETTVDAVTSAEATYEIVTLVPPDAIPAIENPRFVTGAEADAQYGDNELVIGVAINGDARAYSIPFLSRHEIVNDIVGGQPLAVTW